MDEKRFKNSNGWSQKKQFAVTYYKKACQSVGTPDEVMCRSYTTLGDLYYNEAEYIQASSYYDSAATYTSDEINVGGGLQSRRQSLASLAEHLEVIENFEAQEEVKELSDEELYSLVKAEIEAEDKKLQDLMQITESPADLYDIPELRDAPKFDVEDYIENSNFDW